MRKRKEWSEPRWRVIESVEEKMKEWKTEVTGREEQLLSLRMRSSMRWCSTFGLSVCLNKDSEEKRGTEEKEEDEEEDEERRGTNE